MAALLKRFDRLTAAELDELQAFAARSDLIAVAADGSDDRPHRGGCGPLVALAAGGVAAGLGPQLGLPEQLSWALAIAAALWALWTMARTARAATRSRRLLAEGPWHTLAWDTQRLCYLSFSDCLLADWEDVIDMRWFDETAMPGLADSVWIHTTGGGKALLLPRKGGLFAGKGLGHWFTRLANQWHKVTGRTATRESRGEA